MSNYDLCEPLRAIAGVIGREKALFLAGKVIRWDAAKGKSLGRRGWVYVPNTHTENSVLAGLVEPEDFTALVAVHAGEVLQISLPMAPIRRLRNARIVELHKMGVSTTSVAWLMGLSARQVRNILDRETAGDG